ncbi:MAG: hypothetical protein ACI4JW_10970 [Oscillospiraceae bacterium]
MAVKKIFRTAFAECRVNRKYFIANLILLGASAVFIIFRSSVYINTDYYKTDFGNDTVQYYLPSESLMFLIISTLIGAVACIKIFRDMYDKRESDVLTAMPTSAAERFLSKITSIFLLQIVPLFLIVGGGLLISFAQLAAVGRDYGIDISGSLGGYYVYVFLLILQLTLFTDAVSVFCCCCCGAFAESVYTTVIMTGCLSLLPYFTYNNIFLRFSGLDYFSASELPRIIMSWSYFPLFGLLNDNFFGDAGPESVFTPLIVNMLIGIAVSICVIAVSGFIYRRRDGRSVGSPMAFSWFFEGFMLIGAFTVLIVTAFSSVFWLGIVMAFIITIVIRVIAARAKVTVFEAVKWIAKYAAVLIAFFVTAEIGYLTDGCGVYKNIPKLDSADSELCITMRNGEANVETYDPWISNYYYSDNILSSDMTAKERTELDREIIGDIEEIVFKNREHDMSRLIEGLFEDYSVYYDCSVRINRYVNDEDWGEKDYSFYLETDEETIDEIIKYIASREEMVVG